LKVDLEAFEARFAAEVERSFRDDAIRTAVLIDDQFPDYMRMRDAPEAEFKEIDRAKNIYAFMHAKGLICDVQNWRGPVDDAATVSLLDKARKSDLILLDYQLGASGPKTALNILRHLAVSPHFNLVVLYTAQASTRVALTAATAMRGVAPPHDSVVPTEEVLESAEAILAEERFREVDAIGLREYLTDGKTPWAQELSQALRKEGVALKNLKALADRIARRWLADLLNDYTPEADKVLPLGCAVDAAQPMWVHCGSCFVAIVGKLPAGSQEDEGDYVWQRLGSALRAWHPNIYRLILSDIQNALELEAVADHEAWLDDNLSLGLGLYLLESDDAARGPVSPLDVEGSAQKLIDRFVDIIRRRLATHERISSTAIELLSSRLSTEMGDLRPQETARHARARELAHIRAERAIDWQREVLPTVNAFVVSDTFRGGHVTTGTVLRGPDDVYWLCASPACDLVPRTSGPMMVQLIRLERTTTPQDKFTPGEFVIIVETNGITVLRALEAKARQPSLEMLILPNGTRAGRQQPGGPSLISGWIATEAGLRAASVAHGFPARDGTAGGAEVPPELAPQPGATEIEPPPAVADSDGIGAKPRAPVDFVIVSQLRTSFATRFLMAAGQYQSRVGVDYVDL
jgi:Response receiver domain